MSGPRRKTLTFGLLLAMGSTLCASGQVERSDSAREKLIGTWRLIRIDAPSPNGQPASDVQPKGILIYTQDGHMSVQLMYPASAKTLSNEYVLNGYEASFGSYDVDEATRTVTHHVQGSITRNLLVGKDLARKVEFTPENHLIIRSTRLDEHWSVTWERY